MSVALVRVPSWWMRRAAHPENVMAPLELGYAAALLERRAIPATILDLEALRISEEEALTRLRQLDPEHLVLQAITPAVPHALRLAAAVRKALPRLRQVVLVGQHATVLPESVLGEGSPIDRCIRGEFERVLADLIQQPQPAPEGIVERRDGRVQISETIHEIHALDDLPLPTHAAFRHPAYRVFHPTGVRARWRWGFLMSSRGCPYRCVYCSPTLRNSFGRRYRYRSTDSVLTEIALLQRLGFTILHFKDDVFTLHRERILELCEAIGRRGWRLNFTAQTRPDLVDLPLAQALQRAGCRTLGLGVESGSPRVLQRLGKGSTIEQAHAAFRWCREAGLRTVAFFMLGIPGETEADIQATHRLMLDLRPDMIQVAFFTPYPGSAAYSAEADSGRELQAFSHYNAPDNLSEVDGGSLRRWQKRFYFDLLLRTGFLRRTLRDEGIPILMNLDRYLDFARLSAKFLLRRSP